jgi:hypothetical protein
MSRMDRQVSVIFLVSMYECHGWTDKFQLFQFQFSRIQSVSLSVRTEVPTKKKKKKMLQNRNTDPIGGNTLNVTDGTIQEQTCRTINITFSQYARNARTMHAIQCTYAIHVMQCNAMQCNVMEVRPSVRNEVSQSFFLFFYFF